MTNNIRNIVSRDKARLINFKSVAGDWGSDFVYQGMTKSGRMKVSDVTGSYNGNLVLGRNKITRVKPIKANERFDKRIGKRHMISMGGSALNGYYLDVFD